jgi:gluconate kinase
MLLWLCEMIIIVSGVSGSGKTTIGELLAESLNCDFQDADSFHPSSNIHKIDISKNYQSFAVASL